MLQTCEQKDRTSSVCPVYLTCIQRTGVIAFFASISVQCFCILNNITSQDVRTHCARVGYKDTPHTRNVYNMKHIRLSPLFFSKRTIPPLRLSVIPRSLPPPLFFLVAHNDASTNFIFVLCYTTSIGQTNPFSLGAPATSVCAHVEKKKPLSFPYPPPVQSVEPCDAGLGRKIFLPHKKPREQCIHPHMVWRGNVSATQYCQGLMRWKLLSLSFVFFFFFIVSFAAFSPPSTCSVTVGRPIKCVQML